MSKRVPPVHPLHPAPCTLYPAPSPALNSLPDKSTMPKSAPNPTFDLTCPDCGAILKVDATTRAVIAHTPAPRKRTFEDFDQATRHLR